MEDIPRPFSPPYVPQPLNPSPFHTRSLAPERVATPAVLPEQSGSPLYLSTVTQPTQEPNDIIHDYYHVSPISLRLEPDGSVPRTVEMPLVHVAGTRPTHVLAVLSSDGQFSGSKVGPSRGSGTSLPSLPPSTLSSAPSPDPPQRINPYLIPIDAESFFLKFGHSVARSLGAALASRLTRSSPPLIRSDRATDTRFITLPVIPLYVPHPSSLPHVLLFGQGIPLPSASSNVTPLPSRPSPLRGASSSHHGRSPGSSSSTLATYLLPLAAIEEFPSAPAMAAVMAHQCSEEALQEHVAFNQGIWRNVLLLAPTDITLVDLIRTAWNVTSEARRLQSQLRTASASTLSSRSPSPAFESTTITSNTTTRDVANGAEKWEKEEPLVPSAPIPLPVTSASIRAQTTSRDVARDAEVRELHQGLVSPSPLSLPPLVSTSNTTRNVPESSEERKRYKSSDTPVLPALVIPPVPRIPSVLSISPVLPSPSMLSVLSLPSVPSVPPALASPLPPPALKPTAVKLTATTTSHSTTKDAMQRETDRPPVSKLTRDIAKERERHYIRPTGLPAAPVSDTTLYSADRPPVVRFADAVSYIAMPSLTSRAHDLQITAPRLPVIEVDYPVDFAADVQYAVAESFEQLSL